VIGIVVLNFENWGATLECVDSISRLSDESERRIYVVDNGSKRPAPGLLRQGFDGDDICLIENAENLGYAAGNNVGIFRAMEDKCDYILVANSDTIFMPGSLDTLCAVLAANDRVGIVGPLLVDATGAPQEIGMLRRTGLFEKYTARTWLRKLVPWLHSRYYARAQTGDAPLQVHAVSGACFMMTRECASVITPLDEGTFLYEEELIIGLRMERAGYQTLVVPQATVEHAVGSSTATAMRPFAYRCFVESELYYCTRYLNAPVAAVVPLYLLRVAGFLLRAARSRSYRAVCGGFLISTSSALASIAKAQS